MLKVPGDQPTKRAEDVSPYIYAGSGSSEPLEEPILQI